MLTLQRLRLKSTTSVLANRSARCCAEMWNTCLFGFPFEMHVGVYYVFTSWISNSVYIILKIFFESLAILQCLAAEHDSDICMIQAVFHPFLSFLCYSSASGNIVHIVLHSLAYWDMFSCLWGEREVGKVFLGFNLKPLLFSYPFSN